MSPNQEALLTAETPQELVVECTHHWVIDTPSGPVSRGACKRCGEVREFRNYADNTPYWEDELDRSAAKANLRSATAIGETSDKGDE